MKKISHQLSMLVATVMATSMLIVVPVSAIENDDAVVPTQTEDSSQKRHSGRGGSGESQTGLGDVKSSETSSDTQPEDKTTEQAIKKIAEERKNHKTKNLEARQKSCEARKESIEKKVDNFSRNAEKHLAVFNGIYTKVLNFQEEKQVPAPSYTRLKAAAETKKAAATTAVEAIKGLDTSLDCTADDPAVTVAAMKETISTARKALHDYRVSIKNLVLVLQNATDDDSTDTEATQ